MLFCRFAPIARVADHVCAPTAHFAQDMMAASQQASPVCPSSACQAQQRQWRDCPGLQPSRAAPVARPFLQRGAIGGDRLLQPRGAALALAKRPRARCRGSSASSPSGAARARGSIPPARRGRRRPPPPAAPCRSRARRASGARCRGCSASSPSRAARARGSIPPARRGRRRPPPPAAPCRSRARPSVRSALPRLFCVVAQSSGTRSRVCSSSAAR